MKKCIVLFSGGLDSRLALKIMQEQGFDVLAVFFKLPFVLQKVDLNLIGNAIIEIIKNKILLASTIPVDWEEINYGEGKYSDFELSIMRKRPDITFRGRPSTLDQTLRLKEFQEHIESLPSLNDLTYIVPKPRDYSRIFA